MICLYCAQELGRNMEYYHKCASMKRAGASTALSPVVEPEGSIEKLIEKWIEEEIENERCRDDTPAFTSLIKFDAGIKLLMKHASSFTADLVGRRVLEWLRSDEAKTVRHCNENIQRLFGQTPSVLADFLEQKLKDEGILKHE